MSQRSIIYGGVIHSVLCMLTTVSQKKSNNIKEICALANKPILSGTEYIVYQQKGFSMYINTMFKIFSKS